MNTFGRKFRVSVFGESHGSAIGVVLDGVTPGLSLTEEDIGTWTERRRAGAAGTTARRERDLPHIVSGVFEGKTTGAPLTIIFENNDVRSADYESFSGIPRPGHADMTALKKYKFTDYRGGGHFSGRLTLPLVAAGAVAAKMLSGIEAKAAVVELGGDPESEHWDALLSSAASEGDSLGAVVECTVKGIPAGLGEPFWDSVESLVSHAVFSVPGVRGIEFGDGFAAAAMKGSEHNDPFGLDGLPLKNGSGGVNGGITNGAPLCFRVAFKPTSSISRLQHTLNLKTGQMELLSIKGRHDVCFALRTPVVLEAVTMLVLADLLLCK